MLFFSRTGAACALAALIGLSLAAPAATQPPHAGHGPVPRSELVTQHGKPFAMANLRGKVILLNFIFTHCASICPLQTQAIARVIGALPNDVRQQVHVVSVSIDPARDTPAVLARFAASHGVDLSGWTFVTGSKEAVAALSTTYSARALPDGAAPLDHRTEIRLISAGGKLLQTYAGTPLDEPRLIREIQTVARLSNQASAR